MEVYTALCLYNIIAIIINIYQVLSINIDPFFKSPKPNYEEFLGYSTLQVHARMFTKGTEDLDKVYPLSCDRDSVFGVGTASGIV